MSLLKEFKAGKLPVCIYESRSEMGTVAAKDAVNCLKKQLGSKSEVNVLFAAAPSQNEFLEALRCAEGVDWTRVNAFHMDEYVGIDPAAAQGFAQFLRERIFSKLPFRTVNYLNSMAEPKAETERYSALLRAHPLDISFMGVGENGHIAFNDPPVADFNDPLFVKIVELEERCRRQQVHDGCFESLEQVPTHAFTLTVPVLFASREIFCMVPAATKANAIRDMLKNPVSTKCPASILTTHIAARLYLDADSGKFVL